MQSIKYLLVAVFVFLAATLKVNAQTPEASVSASSSAKIQITKTSSDIKANSQEKSGATAILKNLERLTSDEAQKEQIKNNYDEVGEKKKGFIARVVSVKGQSVKVKTGESELFLVPDKSTTLVKKDEIVTADTVTMTDWFAVDDWLVVIGVEDGETFLPRRISISAESLEPQEQVMVRGAVKTLNKTKLEAVPSNAVAAESFLITAKTVFQNADGSEVDTKKIVNGTAVLIVGTKASNGSMTAGIVRVLSYLQ
jgi:hypothetical protein